MHRLLAALLFTLCGFGSAFGTTTTTEAPPRFSDFPVHEAYHGKPAPAQPASAFDNRFRTVIRKGAEHGPNFAGHYTVVIWGCGTSCAQFVIVDASSGRVYDPPFNNVAGGDTKGILKAWGLHYQLDSALFVAQGCPDERNCATRYYKWNGESLVPLTTGPVERFPEPPYVPPTITVKP